MAEDRGRTHECGHCQREEKVKIKLTPDKDIKVEKRRIGCVPVLILRTKDKASARVGLLWIHGGGYILGMKEMVYMGRAQNLVKKYGVTVLSPGYRLAWLKPYPAAVEDCYAALHYTRKGLESTVSWSEVRAPAAGSALRYA